MNNRTSMKSLSPTGIKRRHILFKTSRLLMAIETQYMPKKETLCRIQTKVINNHTEIIVQGNGRRGKKQYQKHRVLQYFLCC